jgi:tetratricopeptide (TPR) repeat protein
MYRSQHCVSLLHNSGLFSENQMNNLGYRYLNNNKIADAIEAFKLNVEIYPESFNVYDSLGEAYLKNKDYALALLNYQKALELFPENKYAQRMVKEIKAKI